MSFDQALFKAFKDRYDAAGSTLAGYIKPGTFDREENKRDADDTRRIGWQMLGPQSFDYFDDSAGVGPPTQIKVNIARVRIHVWVKDSEAFGTGDTPEETRTGGIDDMMDQLIALYDNQLLVVSGFTTVELGLGVTSVGAAPRGWVHRFIEYYLPCTTSGDSITVLSNASATLGGFTMPVFEFAVDDVSCPEALSDCTGMTSETPQFDVGVPMVRGHVLMIVSIPHVSFALHNTSVALTFITYGGREEGRKMAETVTIYRWGQYRVRKNGPDVQGMPQVLRADWFSVSNTSPSFIAGGIDNS